MSTGTMTMSQIRSCNNTNTRRPRVDDENIHNRNRLNKNHPTFTQLQETHSISDSNTTQKRESVCPLRRLSQWLWPEYTEADTTEEVHQPYAYHDTSSNSHSYHLYRNQAPFVATTGVGEMSSAGDGDGDGDGGSRNRLIRTRIGRGIGTGPTGMDNQDDSCMTTPISSSSLNDFSCRTCRVRKVECDRTLPRCSHCLDQQLLCFYVEPLRISRKKLQAATCNSFPGGHGQKEVSAVQERQC